MKIFSTLNYYLLALRIALAVGRVVPALHRAVVVRHSVQVVQRLVVPGDEVVLNEVRLEVEVCQGELDGRVLLLEPAARVCEVEPIQVYHDYMRQLRYVELLHAIPGYLAARALPARDFLTADIFLHALLQKSLLFLSLLQKSIDRS